MSDPILPGESTDEKIETILNQILSEKPPRQKREYYVQMARSDAKNPMLEYFVYYTFAYSADEVRKEFAEKYAPKGYGIITIRGR